MTSSSSSSINIQSGTRPDGRTVGVIKADGARVGSFIIPNSLQVNVFGPGGNVIASIYNGSPQKTVRVTPYFDQDVQIGALEDAVEHWGQPKTFVSSSQEGLELLGRIFQEHLSRQRTEAEAVRAEREGEATSTAAQIGENKVEEVPSADDLLQPQTEEAPAMPRYGGLSARKEMMAGREEQKADPALYGLA